jgi:hypothetical protein
VLAAGKASCSWVSTIFRFPTLLAVRRTVVSSGTFLVLPLLIFYSTDYPS